MLGNGELVPLHTKYFTFIALQYVWQLSQLVIITGADAVAVIFAVVCDVVAVAEASLFFLFESGPS